MLIRIPHPTSATRNVIASLYLLLAMCLAGCSAPGPVLNSERIEEAFGSYGVEIIREDGNLRVTSLYSGTGDDAVTRTFAVVRFADRIPATLAKDHAAVLSGQSLGAVFKAAGWQIDKRNVFVGELSVPPNRNLLAELMKIPAPETIAAHVYLFVVSKDGRSYNYANIVELHHPEFLTVEKLRELYGEVIFDDSNRSSIDDFIDLQVWMK